MMPTPAAPSVWEDANAGRFSLTTGETNVTKGTMYDDYEMDDYKMR